jgi:hypothetical protein
MSDDGTTVGFWDPADDDTVAEFDDQLSRGPNYSRSAAIRDVLGVATDLDHILERSAYDVRLTDREAVPLIREAINRMAREEFEE